MRQIHVPRCMGDGASTDLHILPGTSQQANQEEATSRCHANAFCVHSHLIDRKYGKRNLPCKQEGHSFLFHELTVERSAVQQRGASPGCCNGGAASTPGPPIAGFAHAPCIHSPALSRSPPSTPRTSPRAASTAFAPLLHQITILEGDVAVTNSGHALHGPQCSEGFDG